MKKNLLKQLSYELFVKVTHLNYLEVEDYTPSDRPTPRGTSHYTDRLLLKLENDMGLQNNKTTLKEVKNKIVEAMRSNEACLKDFTVRIRKRNEKLSQTLQEIQKEEDVEWN